MIDYKFASNRIKLDFLKYFRRFGFESMYDHCAALLHRSFLIF
ncbi:hypothetical protein LEP1GSC047_4263 [Leptospira inadai serovar Lyme str. 10]|uniref:Uncharacterized protein n=1 Tax=Leptospira inadai serovar Lyme str. 10 TaxID=1049790 RepID=V6HYF9_9LEPT|nr:hypothetical protein LEP1GSC047_4263 [Leptospira inadai serovar Lyme str. 10]